MDAQPVEHDTFTLTRRYALSVPRLFAAFADPEKKRRWYAEAETHQVEDYEMEFRPGGTERFRYRLGANTPFPGVELASEGVFYDIVEDRRIVTASRMLLGGRCFSASMTTIELSPDGDGAVLTLTHQGAFFEGADGPQMRKAGWEQILDSLSRQLAN